MRVALGRNLTRLILPALFLTIIALFLASGLLRVPQYHILAGIALAAIFIISFAYPEAGLYVLIFSMLLSPEVLVGQVGGVKATLERGVTLRLDDFLLLVIGLSWFARTAVAKEIGLLRKTPLNRPIFLYVLVIVTATAWGFISGRVEGKAGFFYSLKLIEYFFVYFMTVNILRDKEHVRKLVIALLVTCALVSIYGILQIPAGGRVTAPFEGKAGEPNTFGGYLVLMLSIILAFIFAHENFRVRVGMLPMLFILIPLLFSLSRSSFMALGTLYLAFLVFSPRRTALVLGIIFMIMAGPRLVPERVKARIAYTWRQPHAPHPIQVEVFGLRLDPSTSIRIRAYRQAFRDWLKHPLLGYGVTGYRFMDAQFPRVLTETGILGLGAFIWLLVTVFQVAKETYQQTTTPLFRVLGLGLMTGLLALVAHSLGTNTFIIVRIMEPFWLLTGIVVRLKDLEEQEHPVRSLQEG
jgi:hypothetical protein